MPYILAPDFTFCEPGGRRIFLDLRGDRYFCLSEEADIAFSALVDGTPSPGDLERLEALRRNGMLHVAAEAEPPRACGTRVIDFAPLDDEPAPESQAVAVLDAAVRLWLAKRALRHRPLYAECAELRRAKAGLCARDSAANGRELVEMAFAFQASGRYVEALDECLAVSLALARQALHRRFRAELILGVRLRPFQAHAWVMVDGMLISDRLHVVRQFTPILIL